PMISRLSNFGFSLCFVIYSRCSGKASTSVLPSSTIAQRALFRQTISLILAISPGAYALITLRFRFRLLDLVKTGAYGGRMTNILQGGIDWDGIFILLLQGNIDGDGVSTVV